MQTTIVHFSRSNNKHSNFQCQKKPPNAYICIFNSQLDAEQNLPLISTLLTYAYVKKSKLALIIYFLKLAINCKQHHMFFHSWGTSNLLLNCEMVVDFQKVVQLVLHCHRTLPNCKKLSVGEEICG